MVLGLSTIIAYSPHFPLNLITKKIQAYVIGAWRGEIPPYYDLAYGLEQALGRIQYLEAAVHSFLAIVARWWAK